MSNSIPSQKADSTHIASEEGKIGHTRPQTCKQSFQQHEQKPQISALHMGEADGPAHCGGHELRENTRPFKMCLESLKKVLRAFLFTTSRSGDGQNFCHRSQVLGGRLFTTSSSTSFSSTWSLQLVSQVPGYPGSSIHPTQQDSSHTERVRAGLQGNDLMQ